jgi:hypothetical protein
MPIYDVSAREVTYLSFIIEADTPAEAEEKAKILWGNGMALVGDTVAEEFYVCGEYGV